MWAWHIKNAAKCKKMPATPAGRAMAICIGVLGGGGLGFYYKEQYWTKRNEIVRDQLQEELHRLRKERTSREKLANKN